jgi:hypothetical protein
MPMHIKTASDWDTFGTTLHAQWFSAPQRTKADLAKMYAHIHNLVTQLSKEEVELRRNRRATSPRQQDLLQKINKSITEFEQWLVIAQLSFG